MSDHRDDSAYGIIVIAVVALIVVVGLFLLRQTMVVQSWAVQGASLTNDDSFCVYYNGNDLAKGLVGILYLHSDDTRQHGMGSGRRGNGNYIMVDGHELDYTLPKPGESLLVVEGKPYDFHNGKLIDAQVDAAGQLTITQKPDTDPMVKTLVAAAQLAAASVTK